MSEKKDFTGKQFSVDLTEIAAVNVCMHFGQAVGAKIIFRSGHVEELSERHPDLHDFLWGWRHTREQLRDGG